MNKNHNSPSPLSLFYFDIWHINRGVAGKAVSKNYSSSCPHFRGFFNWLPLRHIMLSSHLRLLLEHPSLYWLYCLMMARTLIMTATHDHSLIKPEFWLNQTVWIHLRLDDVSQTKERIRIFISFNLMTTTADNYCWQLLLTDANHLVITFLCAQKMLSNETLFCLCFFFEYFLSLNFDKKFALLCFNDVFKGTFSGIKR